MRTSKLFGAKKITVFSKFMVCLHEQGRVEPVTFCGQGERSQFFAILCGRLLWTAPYDILKTVMINTVRKRLDTI